MPNTSKLVILLAAMAVTASTAPAQANSEIRAELEKAYKENIDAFTRSDLSAIMALRAPDFHSITPDGRTQDRRALELYITGFLNGVRKWNQQTITIDSLDVKGDTAIAVISQYLDRMALRPDQRVHRVETWVTQRETWVKTGSRWLLWRVDQLRNQRRLVDGQAQ